MLRFRRKQSQNSQQTTRVPIKLARYSFVSGRNAFILQYITEGTLPKLPTEYQPIPFFDDFRQNPKSYPLLFFRRMTKNRKMNKTREMVGRRQLTSFISISANLCYDSAVNKAN
jgi:hypothetical protein